VQFSPTGTRTYATFLGGSSDDVILAMAVSSGTAYVAGLTGSQNFPTANAAQAKNGSTAASTMDAFVAAISGFAGSGGGTGPSISSVTNAFGDSSTIAPNTWVALKGTKLAPAGKSRIWQDADFANNRMPISLDGVSVKMNGKDAFVYFISETQINVLTPPDLTAGPVQVVLTNNGTASAAFTVQAQPYSESFFVYNGGPYVIAVHLDASRIGPPSLFPGLTTPAKPNEKIVLFANGFGPITPPVVSGSVTQSGPLPSLPVVKIGANPATVEFAGLISPGLYQFNIVVPAGTPDGDNSITASFAGLNTQAGTLITIQH
jgi:uncharacterized protein (TIGR03437 family)